MSALFFGWLRVLSCWLSVLALLWPAPARAQDAQFEQDFARLTQAPHRLAGTPEGAAAGLYLEQRLRSLGVPVYPLDMPVWQTRTERCELLIEGQRILLVPLRPSLFVPPVTPAEGISGALLYAGDGEGEVYGARSPLGKIVVLDYGSSLGWERAFALGAKAVVFLGNGTETPAFPKHAEVPLNLPRFYVAKSELAGLDLTADHPQATLHAEVSWQLGRARTLVTRIRGSAPTFAQQRSEPEALVLAASYDTFGVVPERSPGARGAANVAALLEAVSAFKKQPAKRDVVLVFLDAELRGHQGSRELYDALSMPEETSRQLSAEHRAELAEVEAVAELLARHGLGFELGAKPAGALVRALSEEADFARDDVRKELSNLRLAEGAERRQRRGHVGQREAELDARWLLWDEIRRALHDRALPRFVKERAASREPGAAPFPELFQELQRRTGERIARRREQLRGILAMDQQREQLREALSVAEGATRKPLWIALHASFDFGGQGKTFGAVVGDYTARLFDWRPPKPYGDMPGYYGRVLSVLAGAAKLGPLPGLDARSLSDPTLGTTFAPDPFVASGASAGSYGIYNLSLMTGYDARQRDGQPADVAAALDAPEIQRQARSATELMQRVASSADLSLPRVFNALAVSKYPRFEAGASRGDYAGLSVSGRMREDRPAAGALVAIAPGAKAQGKNAWITRSSAALVLGFDPSVLEAVDERGHFRVIGLREDLYTEVQITGASFGAGGRLAAISTQENQAQKLTDAMRVNLFFATPFGFVMERSYETKPELLKLLKGSSDAPFRDNRMLFGQLEGFGFAYVSDQIVDYRLKLFQPMGPVVLGSPTQRLPDGQGVAPGEFGLGTSLSAQTAADLYRLNERRLSELRRRGVTSADLEILHNRAKHQRELAKAAPDVASRQASEMRSSALSHRVYLPLRQTMDDLVHAIVMLLLLAIPFAYALERLSVGASSIYGRIAGFVLWFSLTFALLYWLHPGFAIASTPVIIFLAFAIVLLSSLVIYIVVRKFKVELRSMQGQAGNPSEVSRMGTLLAAVSMGISTMRRRPTRTTLTAITVVMLTFTILCFASFTRKVGVRELYQGPTAEGTAPRVLVRKLDYSPILPGVLDMLHGMAGATGKLFGHYWLVGGGGTQRFSVARLSDGESLTVDAVLGVSSRELPRWPALAQALGGGALEAKQKALAEGGVFLPAIVPEVLKLTPGERILLNGRSVTFAGVTDGGALQRLRHLDGQSLLPVDFKDPAALAAGANAAASTDAPLAQVDESDRDFVHLASDQVVLASDELVEGLGGGLASIGVYPEAGLDPSALGRRIAEVVVMPVWAAGPSGVDRLLLTVLTEVSGGLALFVPLLLGGLIIFGTLLGSISDREKEIYTFSALGLSPGHVGVLFFAEASVYAVVGGMGGQLLAQLVGLATAVLARRGVIEPANINYSSTNSLFAIGVVMLTVLVSAIYPALRAGRSANPGLTRSWKMPPAVGDKLELKFPFTVSAYDITGVVSFLAEHLRRHDDAGLGDFATSAVGIRKTDSGHLELWAELALAPFDLGVTESLTLTAVPSEIEGVDEIALSITRHSGADSDWYRANRVFLRDLRRQFLVWRTLSSDAIEAYRLQTLTTLGDAQQAA